MPDVIVKRNVILRSIVTDKLKQELDEELQHGIDEIDQRIQQIDFRSQPYITDLQRTNIQQAMAIRKQVEAEKAKQQQLREQLRQRKEQIQALENDDEVIRGSLESQVAIEEGDNLTEVLAGVEIITKDDVVVEIRQRQIADFQQEDVPQIITDLTTQTDVNASP